MLAWITKINIYINVNSIIFVYRWYIWLIIVDQRWNTNHLRLSLIYGWYMVDNRYQRFSTLIQRWFNVECLLGYCFRSVTVPFFKTKTHHFICVSVSVSHLWIIVYNIVFRTSVENCTFQCQLSLRTKTMAFNSVHALCVLCKAHEYCVPN